MWSSPSQTLPSNQSCIPRTHQQQLSTRTVVTRRRRCRTRATSTTMTVNTGSRLSSATVTVTAAILLLLSSSDYYSNQWITPAEAYYVSPHPHVISSSRFSRSMRSPSSSFVQRQLSLQEQIQSHPQELQRPNLQARIREDDDTDEFDDDKDTMTHKRVGFLSHDEQNELLRHAVELRRITQLQKEYDIRNDGTISSSSKLLQLSRDAGYGDEVHLLQQAIEIGQVAREQLVTTNMGLVYHVVNTIMGKPNSQRNQLQSLHREDLIQEGAIGLARAVDHWNPQIGGKFSTYAYYWIKAAVLRGIAQRDDMIRIPEHMQTNIRKVNQAAQSLGLLDTDATLGGNMAPTAVAKVLADETGLTAQQVRNAMQVYDRTKQRVLSFESWMEQGKDVTGDDAASNPSAVVDLSTSTSSSDELDDWKASLSKFLRPKELEALCWRYGLLRDCNPIAKDENGARDYVAEAEQELYGSSAATRTKANNVAGDLIPTEGKWGEAMSFIEVGKRMKVSAEYGRRLCHAALHKLRRAAQEGALSELAFQY